jgi:hypothetical protein
MDVSSMSRLICHQGDSLHYLLNNGLCRSLHRSGLFEGNENMLPLPRNWITVPQLSSQYPLHCTNNTITAMDIFMEIISHCCTHTNTDCNAANCSHIKGLHSNSSRLTAVTRKVPQHYISIHFLFKVCYLIMLSSGKII